MRDYPTHKVGPLYFHSGDGDILPCWKLQALQIASVANCACCKLRVLKIESDENCMCCKLQVLQIARVAKLRKIRGQADRQADKQSTLSLHCKCCKLHDIARVAKLRKIRGPANRQADRQSASSLLELLIAAKNRYLSLWRIQSLIQI